MALQLSPRITFTRPSRSIWHVWLDDERVGAVHGDRAAGFIASDNDHHFVAQNYISAEAAMQAWVRMPHNRPLT